MMAYNYRNINFEVMSDTEHCYITNTELVNAVRNSIANQFMVAEEENIDQPISKTTHTRYIVSGKRSF